MFRGKRTDILHQNLSLEDIHQPIPTKLQPFPREIPHLAMFYEHKSMRGLRKHSPWIRKLKNSLKHTSILPENEREGHFEWVCAFG